MSDLEKLSGLIDGELKDIRTKMTEQVQLGKKGSARHEELSEQLTKAYDDMDEMKGRMDAMETAGKRLSAAEELAEEKAELVAEHKSATDKYLRSNIEGDLRAIEQKLLNVGSDPDGGYLASSDATGRIVKQVYETSDMRPIAFVQETSKKEIELFVDRDEVGANWAGENNLNPDIKTPQTGKITIPVHKLEAMPGMTVEMLQDADFDVQAWLESKVADKFSRTENSAFVNGDGVLKPRGFMTYPSGTTGWKEIERTVTAASGLLDEIDIVDLVASLKTEYRRNGSFAMSRRTNAVLRKIQDNDGQFLFTGQDLNKDTFYNYKLHLFEDMVNPTTGVTYAAGSLPIAFGDFREAYTIVDRMGIAVTVDNITNKGTHLYYTTKRCGGDVTNFEALKLLEIKA